VLYLVSDEEWFITGTKLVIDGGCIAQYHWTRAPMTCVGHAPRHLILRRKDEYESQFD
jgi:hypothetical protein